LEFQNLIFFLELGLGFYDFFKLKLYSICIVNQKYAGIPLKMQHNKYNIFV